MAFGQLDRYKSIFEMGAKLFTNEMCFAREFDVFIVFKFDGS